MCVFNDLALARILGWELITPISDMKELLTRGVVFEDAQGRGILIEENGLSIHGSSTLAEEVRNEKCF